MACLQSLSGTGSLRIGAAFIAKFLAGTKVYVSNPTWGASCFFVPLCQACPCLIRSDPLSSVMRQETSLMRHGSCTLNFDTGPQPRLDLWRRLLRHSSAPPTRWRTAELP